MFFLGSKPAIRAAMSFVEDFGVPLAQVDAVVVGDSVQSVGGKLAEAGAGGVEVRGRPVEDFVAAVEERDPGWKRLADLGELVGAPAQDRVADRRYVLLPRGVDRGRGQPLIVANEVG